MKKWQTYCAGLLALVAGSPAVWAQAVPGVGAPAAGGAAAVGGGAAAPAAAPPQNLWSFLCLTPEQKKKCKDCFCNSPLGQLLTNAAKPVTLFSGGLVPDLCPPPNQPNPDDLKKDPEGPEGAAARIKKLEAEAKARRAAVRYLGTVDCRRYPEAEAALINALRGDPNECVRLEAALALNRGCCCTRKVLEALVLTVSSRADKDPPERSPRVLAAAAAALEHCRASYCDVVPAPAAAAKPPEVPRPPEAPGSPAPPRPDELPPPSQVDAGRVAPDPLVEDARRLVAWRQQALQQARQAKPERPQAVTPKPALLNPAVTSPAPAVGRAPVTLGATAPAAGAGPEPVAAGGIAPPTGQRDMWHLLVNAVRGR